MKRIYFILTCVVAAGLVLLGCSKNNGSGRGDNIRLPEGEEPAALTVTPAESDVGDGAADVTLTIDASHDWTATADADWCRLKVAAGKAGRHEITASVEANASSEERTAVIEVKTDYKRAVAHIRQAASPSVALSATSLAIDAAGGEKVLAMKANVNWTIASDQAWCKVTPTEGKAGTTAVTIACENNATGAVRVAKLTLRAGSSVTIITVSQK